jgi:hypothetical protein
MDEAAFRQVLSEAIERPCTFEKALQTRCVTCNLAGRIQIAEREVVACRNADSLSRCTALHDLLRHNFSFALKKATDDTVLSHAQEMRVQCGGLRGIQLVLNGHCETEDVDALLADILRRWGSLDDIPYSEVVHAAAGCYRGRHG